MKRVIITGATSMIGMALIEEILSHNVDKIFAIIRPHSDHISRLPISTKISVVECDISDYSSLPLRINNNCDVFYHIAWGATGVNRNASVLSQSKNIEYTLEALRAAKELGCSKFIGTGSQAEYGKLDLPKLGPNDPTNPIQPYGIVKYAAGRLTRIEASKMNIDCFWIRVFSVYGKYDKDTSMIMSSLKKMLNGEHASFTACEQLWDYLYSSDAGKALYLIGENACGNKVYCLGNGNARPLHEYVKVMRDAVNPDIKIGMGEIPYSKFTPMSLCADVSELNSEFNWYPKTDFAAGIKLIIQYIKDN